MYYFTYFIVKNYPTDSSCSSDEIGNNSNQKTLNFAITFSPEEWKSISPRPTTYYDGKCRSRTRLVLKQFEWSNVIQEHFFLHTSLPCAISFKKARVSEFGQKFVTINGKCKECYSIIEGYIKEVPALNTRLVH